MNQFSCEPSYLFSFDELYLALSLSWLDLIFIQMLLKMFLILLNLHGWWVLPKVNIQLLWMSLVNSWSLLIWMRIWMRPSIQWNMINWPAAYSSPMGTLPQGLSLTCTRMLTDLIFLQVCAGNHNHYEFMRAHVISRTQHFRASLPILRAWHSSCPLFHNVHWILKSMV